MNNQFHDDVSGVPGIGETQSSRRSIVRRAAAANSTAGARMELEALFGNEITALRAQEKARIDRGYATGNAALLGTAFSQPSPKRPRSDGARWAA